MAEKLKQTPPDSPLPVKAFITPADKMTAARDSTMRYMGANLYTGSKGCVSDLSQLTIDEGKKIKRVLLLGEEECEMIHARPNTNYKSGALAQAHAYIDNAKEIGEPVLVCGGYGMVRAPFVVCTYRLLKEGKTYNEIRTNMLQYLKDEGRREDYFQTTKPFQLCGELIEKIKTVDYSAIEDDNDKRRLYMDYKKQLKNTDAAVRE